MRYVLTSRIFKGLSLASFLLLGSSAWAECACFCVNGELQTMCTAIEEAQDDPVLCSAYRNRECPEEPGSTVGASYTSPHEDALNCRDIRVFDALRGVFVDLKACDVAEAS